MSGRKTILILLLVALVLGSAWILIRWKHFEALTRSECVTEWTDKDEAWFWRVPVRIDLNESDCDPLTVGAALNHYASAREVTLRRNTGEWLDRLFSEWGHRQSVKELYVMYSNLNDGHMKGFGECDLKFAMFNNNLISGDVFPHCTHLVYLEFNGTPITDGGLANIAVKCPEMERVCLYESQVTVAGVRNSGIFKNPALRLLRIVGLDCTETELQRLREQGTSINQRLRLDTE